jgi:uncharacterized protein
MPELTLENAITLLNTHMQNQNLRRHCYAVGKTLAEFFDLYKTQNRDTEPLTKDQWEIAGILHDADWEETKDEPTQHTIKTLAWFKDFDTPQEITNALKSHNNKNTHLREPQTLLEWTLECIDELTGFIVAVTLVLPSKKLEDVKVESVLKKFKQKEFAKAVDRSQMEQCEEKINIDLTTLVQTTLSAMQKNHELLGL